MYIFESCTLARLSFSLEGFTLRNIVVTLACPVYNSFTKWRKIYD